MRNDRNKRGGSSRGDARKRSGPSKGPFKKRDEKAGGERGKSFGDRGKTPFRKREDKPAGERNRSYSDRPKAPFGKRDDRAGGERSRPFSDRDKKPFGSRDAKPRERNRSFDDKPKRAYVRRDDKDGPSSRPSGDREKRPYVRRDNKEGTERSRPSGDREKRPYVRRDDREGAQRSRPSGDREKRPYVRRDDSTNTEGRRPYGDRKERGDSDRKVGYSRAFDKKDKFKKKDGRVQKRDAFFDKSRKEGLPAEREEKPEVFSRDKGEFKPRSTPRTEKRTRITGGDSEKSGGKPFSEKRFPAKSFPGRGDDSDRSSESRRPHKFGKEPIRETESSRPWNRKEDHQFYGERRKSKAPMPKTHDDGSVRLNKYIANAGICSRREADELITAGVVTVNGTVITEMGHKVMPGDSVKYNNQLLRSEALVYILLNKPKDFITTTDDPENRKTVMSLIAKAGKERVYPVGRLDRNTTGVLLFTNDGDLAKKLTHPSFEVHKIYQVELDRPLKMADMQQIADGIKLDDGFIKVDEIVYAGSEKNIIGVEIHSGKNRIVRRIFESMEYEVKKLDRVVFAGLTKKDLPRGRWRFLSELEVANLKMMTGKKSAKSFSK